MQYFVTNTQWHLAHTLSRLGSKTAAPTIGDELQLDQTIAWLAHNSDRKISAPRVKGAKWEVYSDSDHAGDRGSGTRSHTGVIILVNGAPVQWRSKKQPVTSTSSAMAEIYALAEAVRDARLNGWKAEELGYERPYPIDIQVDNSTGLLFQSKMSPDSRMKGMIDVRYGWVKELQDNKLVRAVKVHTTNNVADIGTKCHGRVVFEKLYKIPGGKAQELAQEYKATRKAVTGILMYMWEKDSH